MTWKEPEYGIFDPKTGLTELFDKMNDAKCLLMCYEENARASLPGILSLLGMVCVTASMCT